MCWSCLGCCNYFKMFNSVCSWLSSQVKSCNAESLFSRSVNPPSMRSVTDQWQKHSTIQAKGELTKASMLLRGPMFADEGIQVRCRLACWRLCRRWQTGSRLPCWLGDVLIHYFVYSETHWNRVDEFMSTGPGNCKRLFSLNQIWLILPRLTE